MNDGNQLAQAHTKRPQTIRHRAGPARAAQESTPAVPRFVHSTGFLIVFALLTLLMGGLWMAHTQMSRIPDLWEHVYRVSAITNGDIIPRHVDSTSHYHSSASDNVGGKVDWKWIRLSDAHRDPFDSGVVDLNSITQKDSTGADVPFNNTGIYSPVSYLPQIAGFALGKAFGLSAATTFYLAETMMLLAYTILTTWGMSLLPKHRLTMAILLLSPPVIYHFSFAISADSLTQALMILFSCMVMALYRNGPRDGHLVVAGVVAVLLSLTKYAFIPMILLLPVVLAVHRPRPRRQWIIVTSSIILGFCMVAAWMRITSGFVSNPASVSPEEVHGRVLSLFTQPQRALSAIVYSVVHLQGAFRSPVILLLVWAAFAFVAVCVVVDACAPPRNPRSAIFLGSIIVVAAGCVFATYLAMWLQGTPAGQKGVYIMQLRYLVPLMPCMLLCTAEALSEIRTKHAIRLAGADPTAPPTRAPADC